MSSPAEMVQQFESTIQKLLEKLTAFSQEQLNTIPAEGRWSAAQLGEHLRKSYKGVPELLGHNTKITGRDPAEKIAMVNMDFLNFSIKMQAPEFIVPEQKTYDKTKLLQELDSLTKAIIQTAQSLDLTETCTTFAIPGYGEFTRLEWINFCLVHTQRHLRQLEGIFQTVVNNP